MGTSICLTAVASHFLPACITYRTWMCKEHVFVRSYAFSMKGRKLDPTLFLNVVV